MTKLGIALTIYVGIAILAWFTLSDQRIRLVTLAILGLFAIRTVTHEFRRRAEAEDK
ncbi:MAG TPA: hypothetical protein VK738_19080 [Terriglobales bacterium]|nr:hypothetical protein [Terriglobales bacterium]